MVRGSIADGMTQVTGMIFPSSPGPRDTAGGPTNVKDSCSFAWLPGNAVSMDMHSVVSPLVSPASRGSDQERGSAGNHVLNG